LRNAELAHVFTREAKTFGIKVDGEVSFDYGEAFRRTCRAH
jgi:dihydrolipoamide dehydrogenase